MALYCVVRQWLQGDEKSKGGWRPEGGTTGAMSNFVGKRLQIRGFWGRKRGFSGFEVGESGEFTEQGHARNALGMSAGFRQDGMQAWGCQYKAEKRKHRCRYAGKGTRTHPRSYANHLMLISTCVSVRGNSHRSRVWMRRQVQPSMQCQSQPCSMPRWNKQQMQRHDQEGGETIQLANQLDDGPRPHNP